jgi:hypothetical protein
MKNLIVAREKEKAELERLMNEPTAQMLAVYGRRRTGKTFLIREYFEDNFAFKHTAVSPMELKERGEGELIYRVQLNEFAASLRKYGSKDESPISDWFEAFHRLEALIDSKRKKGKLVVFIDELPWLDTPRAGFLSAFEHFCNDYVMGKHNMLLIVCGSATSWMLDNLINNKGGLYGRSTCEMHIHPFTLKDTERYLQWRGLTMDRYDVTQAYMLTGGVAYYLSYFKPGRSLAQNVDEVFFSADGFMQKEYDRLFLSLFEPDVGDDEGDPHTWAKVNPHYDMLAVVRDFYSSQWDDAQGSSEQLHEFRVKQLNLFVIDDSARWIQADAVKDHLLAFTINREDFERPPQCALSFDLSVIDDFSCVGYTFFNTPTKQFLVYLDYYLPEDTLKGHVNEELYRGWVEAGYLKLTKGSAIDYREIANDILQRAAWLDIRKCGYDANKSAELRNTLDNSKELHGRLEPFRQSNGSFNLPMEIFERMFYSKTDVQLPDGMPKYQVLFNDNPITPYCFGNAVIDEDSKGNRRPVKLTRHLKIDGTVVTLMGIGMWYTNK